MWWARGTLDLGFWGTGGLVKPTYVIFPQIHNNMPFNGDPLNHQLDSMAVLIEKATITYKWLYGREEVERGHAELLLIEDVEETVYLAGTVDSGGSTGGEPGKMVTGFEAIPHQLGGQLSGLEQDAEGLVLGLEVVIHGTTLGGIEVTTNKFVFPLYLCWGCLQVDNQGDFYMCCDPNADAYLPACVPGQDAVTLPCSCSSSTP